MRAKGEDHTPKNSEEKMRWDGHIKASPGTMTSSLAEARGEVGAETGSCDSLLDCDMPLEHFIFSTPNSP